MRKIEDNCVCCDLPCINCGRRHEEVLYCDNCKENSETLYEYWGNELCQDCLMERIIEDFILNVSENEAINNINTLFNSLVITKNSKKEDSYYLDGNLLEEYSYDEVIHLILEDIDITEIENIIDAWNIELTFIN